MNEAFKLFILSILVVNLWTAVMLLLDRRGHKTLNRLFAAFLFCLAAPQLDLYLVHAKQGGVPLVSQIALTFLFLKGPFIWAFISVLAQRSSATLELVRHFIPWGLVIGFVLLIPNSFLWAHPQTFNLLVVVGTLHMLAYLVFTGRQLFGLKRHIARIWSGFPNTAYYWLVYIIFGVVTLVTVDCIAITGVMLGILTDYSLLDYYLFPGFSLYVFSIAILCIYRPSVFKEITQPENNIDSIDKPIDNLVALESLVPNIPAPLADSKERHLELDERLAQGLAHNLTILMQEHHLYRKNELTLPDLALRLGISVHQTSELLNVHIGQSFYDYINSYRLSYACQRLADSNCKLRVLDIAFDAGYNNKNSFYRAFKEATGVTPNQYRENAETGNAAALAYEK